MASDRSPSRRRRTSEVDSVDQFTVQIAPLTAVVSLRHDRRYTFIRIGDYVFDARISPHPELDPLLPGSRLLPVLDELLHNVS